MSGDSDDDLDSAIERDAVTSSDAVTPRGGFMARPGLKTPPRHAVVVRLGDAPESEEIPLARSSVPPPPPSEPLPMSDSDKITLRAIPSPSEPPRHPRESDAPSSESPTSIAPLSDAPLVASVPPARARTVSSRRRSRSSLPMIALAAAAGMLLGFGSIALRGRVASEQALGAASVSIGSQPVDAASIASSQATQDVAVAAPSSAAAVAEAAAAVDAAPAGSSSASTVAPAARKPRHHGAPRSVPGDAQRSIF